MQLKYTSTSDNWW